MSALLDMQRYQASADAALGEMELLVSRMRAAMHRGDVKTLRECSSELRTVQITALSEAARYEEARVAEAHAQRLNRCFDAKMVAAGDHTFDEEGDA